MRPSPVMRRLVPAIAITALVLAACGSDDDSSSGSETDTTEAAAAGTSDATSSTEAGAASDLCSNTIDEGVLTIATGEPAFYPWVIDDAPETGEGFEAAVAYAVAAEMG